MEGRGGAEKSALVGGGAGGGRVGSHQALENVLGLGDHFLLILLELSNRPRLSVLHSLVVARLHLPHDRVVDGILKVLPVDGRLLVLHHLGLVGVVFAHGLKHRLTRATKARSVRRGVGRQGGRAGDSPDGGEERGGAQVQVVLRLHVGLRAMRPENSDKVSYGSLPRQD